MKYDLVGKTLKEVVTILGQENTHSFRVASRDGVPRVLTSDHNEDRFNLHLVDGKVVKYTMG